MADEIAMEAWHDLKSIIIIFTQFFWVEFSHYFPLFVYSGAVGVVVVRTRELESTLAQSFSYKNETNRVAVMRHEK
jgi:hypothetical protein